MNLDNMRLREIQLLKNGYSKKVLGAESAEEADHYFKMIDDLEKEEKQILERCKVKI